MPGGILISLLQEIIIIFFSYFVNCGPGRPDPDDPSKLLLANDKGTFADNPPWVIGKPYLNGASPALSCSDAGKAGLMKFNNQEIELPSLIAKAGQIYNLGIKWAICSKNDVPAGNYKGKAVINIYTRL